MANTLYTTRFRNDAGERSTLYRDLSILFSHLDAFGIRLVSLSITLDVVTITLSDPVRDDQKEHVGLL